MKTTTPRRDRRLAGRPDRVDDGARPLDAVEMPAGPGRRRPLIGGMEVEGHTAFRGRVQLL